MNHEQHVPSAGPRHPIGLEPYVQLALLHCDIALGQVAELDALGDAHPASLGPGVEGGRAVTWAFGSPLATTASTPGAAPSNLRWNSKWGSARERPTARRRPEARDVSLNVEAVLVGQSLPQPAAQAGRSTDRPASSSPTLRPSAATAADARAAPASPQQQVALGVIVAEGNQATGGGDLILGE